MFSNMEGITVAATSLALQWGLLKAIDKLKRRANAPGGPPGGPRGDESARRSPQEGRPPTQVNAKFQTNSKVFWILEF